LDDLIEESEIVGHYGDDLHPIVSDAGGLS
jgi:hypothetical protein